jgi:hypothetical protein
MFILLNKMVNSSPPNFLPTNPFLSIIYLPFYLYDLTLLKKREYVKTEKQIEHIIVEKNINTKNKRCYLYLSILNKIYKSLQLNRPMVVALSVAFEELPYIKNNVGLIIINYEIKDTIETLEEKLKRAYYQAYCSNFIINCPLPNIGNFELRNYVDCIISSMYIKSDFDFKIAWNCSKLPIEQMYVGSVSIIHSDNTMDINMCLNTCSKNYNNSNETTGLMPISLDSQMGQDGTFYQNRYLNSAGKYLFDKNKIVSTYVPGLKCSYRTFFWVSEYTRK